MAAAVRRRPWRADEDALLARLVAMYGSKRARGADNQWPEVARHLPGRSSKDCRKRWFHSLDPTLRKGRWTPAEDHTLLEAYSQLGPVWHLIAHRIPGRKDDQCSKRYAEILDPSAKDRLQPWTPEEDTHLVTEVAKIGHRWTAISEGLPGRPPLTCRNRWRALQNRRRGGQSPGVFSPAAFIHTLDSSPCSAQSSGYASTPATPATTSALPDDINYQQLPETYESMFPSESLAAADEWLQHPMWSDPNWSSQQGVPTDATLPLPLDAMTSMDESQMPNFDQELCSSVPHPSTNNDPFALTLDIEWTPDMLREPSPEMNIEPSESTTYTTVQTEPTSVSTPNKIVYEVHHYHHVVHHYQNHAAGS